MLDESQSVRRVLPVETCARPVARRKVHEGKMLSRSATLVPASRKNNRRTYRPDVAAVRAESEARCSATCTSVSLYAESPIVKII